jgi:UDP:flavonoid glycosyltransferase YjiC (YdhE family)
MNALLVALGSHGDVHPLVGLGLALRSRGHTVTVVANGHFQPLIAKADLGFLELGTDKEYRRLAGNPDLWHTSRSLKVIFDTVLQTVRPLYEIIEGFVSRPKASGNGDAVVVSSSLGFGARVAEEKLGMPMASVHLSPALFRSARDAAVIPGGPLQPWMPSWLKRLVYAAGDKYVIDRLLAPSLNAFRAELGLKPVLGILRDWLHSPRLTIGLFPDWFAPRQPDWPKQIRLTGFPLYDERGIEPLPPQLLQFLDEGGPPIAITPGSAMWQGRAFFESAAEACRLLGHRGLLLTRHREHVPPELPDSVRHIDYAPFSELLPRCSALVHHGGIGTSAQAMAAGVRQVVMPMAYDQPDNAARMARLGVAAIVPPRKFRSVILARALARMLDSPQVAASCRAVAAKFVGADSLGRTCELIEELAPASSGDHAQRER